MTSPKLSKHYMSSPPVSNSARFRSPGIVRRNISGDPGFQSAHFAKKSRRSKSSEANSRDSGSNMLSGKRKLSKEEGTVEQHLEALNNRWRLMAKNQEKMTKEEIMNNYKLLLTDHIKLEKFMSLISRENELTRTRLESDLLDSMMVVEELKQSLAARDLNRRSRIINPRDSEERRELIKQNKKLLHELHESAKKIEKLELTVFELQEQVELKDFQMMEAQNQRTIIEEQLDISGKETKSEFSQTDNSIMILVEKFQKELDSAKSAYASLKTEYCQLLFEMQSIQDDNKVLKISEENLQEEVTVKAIEIEGLRRDIEILEDRLRSYDEAPISVGEQSYVKGPTSREDDTITSTSEDFDDISIATDSGFENSARKALITQHKSFGKDLDLLKDTVKMLLVTLKEKEDEILKLKGDPTGQSSMASTYRSLYDELKEANKYYGNDLDVSGIDINGRKNGEYPDRYSPVGACCSSFYKVQLLEKENRRWKCFVENMGKTDNELLQVIADLEENSRSEKGELEKLRNNYPQSSPQRNVGKTDRSADYFSRRLEEIQFDHTEDQMSALLAEAERIKDDAIRQASRLEDELDSSNRYIEKLDTELTSEKKIQLTLRRRIETLEQRLMSNSFNCANVPVKSVTDLETKISQLETINSSLMEVNSLEKRRMEEQRLRIKELEQANKTLNEKLNIIQTKELFAQKKINRLQGVYEDLLREYAAVKSPNVKSDIFSHQSNNINSIIEENKRLKDQLHDLKSKHDDLQCLLLRYQMHFFGDSNKQVLSKSLNTPNNRSFQSQIRDFEMKMMELSKVN